MLKYSVYSVISPEGCASILWKKAEKAKDAAEAMQITAKSLRKFGLIDDVIEEPLGGAHRSPDEMSDILRIAISQSLEKLLAMDLKELLNNRRARIANYGEFKQN